MRTLTRCLVVLWIALAGCGTPPEEGADVAESEAPQELGPAQPQRPPARCPDVVFTCFSDDVCTSVCGRPSVCNTLTSCCICAVD